jgi:hypothetical protein
MEAAGFLVSKLKDILLPNCFCTAMLVFSAVCCVDINRELSSEL